MSRRFERVLVTGSAGFLGGHLLDALAKLPSIFDLDAVVGVTKARCDLSDLAATEALFRSVRPDLVFHLAASCGGIGANRRRPADFLVDNVRMGLNVLDAAVRHAPKAKLVFVGSVCMYPRDCPVPFREESIFDGFPEETNAPYGEAKRALLVAAGAYRRQHGLDVVTVVPANLYGERDRFDPVDDAHVIPAMIRKFVEARERGDREVVLWGTGAPTREFLHAEDAAEGLILAALRLEGPDPVNLGTGQDVTMFDLADRVAHNVGWDGRVRWDASQPDGQPRRRLDVSRARDRLGFWAKIGLGEGLSRTVEWYKKVKAA